MNVSNHRQFAVESDDSDAPGRARLKELAIAAVNERIRDERALTALRLPDQRPFETHTAGFTRRILQRSAVFTTLQLETASSRGNAESRGSARACGRRYGWSTHVEALSKIAAPEQSPRS